MQIYSSLLAFSRNFSRDKSRARENGERELLFVDNSRWSEQKRFEESN